MPRLFLISKIDALNRLRNQASLDRCRKWYPGQQPTEAEQIINYIDSLIMENLKLTAIATEYRWVKNPDRMGQ